jgi:hypothetical protein
MGEEMRNCPFCYSESVKPISIKKPNTTDEHYYYYRCNSCHARAGVQPTLEKARMAWDGTMEKIKDEKQVTLNEMIETEPEKKIEKVKQSF